jgi:hypothetical protein
MRTLEASHHHLCRVRNVYVEALGYSGAFHTLIASHQHPCKACNTEGHVTCHWNQLIDPDSSSWTYISMCFPRLIWLGVDSNAEPEDVSSKHLRLRITITLVKAIHHCLKRSQKKLPHPNHHFVAQEATGLSPDYFVLMNWLSNSVGRHSR